MQTPRAIAALFFLLLLGVSGFLYYPRYWAREVQRNQLAAALSLENVDVALRSRTKEDHCKVRGPLPDPQCTPGAVFPDVSLETICTPGYTKMVRSVSDKMRRRVFAEYGISYPQPRGSYEVDHLIPLAIGGSNDIANLFPEAAEPKPGFREKDLVEVYLREEVCARRVDLRVAQAAIANNWLSIYRNLPPETIAQLKARYRNWSN